MKSFGKSLMNITRKWSRHCKVSYDAKPISAWRDKSCRHFYVLHSTTAEGSMLHLGTVRIQKALTLHLLSLIMMAPVDVEIAELFLPELVFSQSET